MTNVNIVVMPGPGPGIHVFFNVRRRRRCHPPVGIGSFFVMLPSWPRTLARWRRHGPLWSQAEPEERKFDLVDRIAHRVSAKARELARAPKAEQARWGLAQKRQV